MTAVRLLLVLAILLGQFPCGSMTVTAAAADPAPPPPAAGKRCPCCKRDKAEPPPSPAPAKPAPAKPTCPPDCPCAVCSPGYAPLTAFTDPPRLVEPASDFLPELVPSDTPAGRLARLAAEAGVLVPITTDAHSAGGLGYRELGVAQARRAWLTREQVLNTRPWREIARLRG